MNNLLRVDSLQMRFQGLVALHGVTFDVPKGRITSVIGPNGAGKTTLFNCITGMYRPTDGQVYFAGEDITGYPAHRISRKGVARTFQNLALFHGMTVLENLLVGAYQRGTSGLLQGMVRTRRVRAEMDEARADAMKVLKYLGMDDMADATPSELPYGRQKEIEFGRALMQKAQLILLDEPMAGMSSSEKIALSKLVRRMQGELGLSFLLVEHDMPVVMNLSDRIVVLDFGRKIAEGTPAEVRSDPAVISAYLGS